MRVRNILIIDDEADIVQLVKKRVQANGYEVKSYGRGPGAIQTIQETSPDLLLLDLHLPQVSGVEIYKELRSQSGLKKIPVVFFSADSSQEEFCLKELGAEGFLTKPFDASELMDLIRMTIH